MHKLKKTKALDEMVNDSKLDKFLKKYEKSVGMKR
jgi:hypothetical protein